LGGKAKTWIASHPYPLTPTVDIWVQL